MSGQERRVYVALALGLLALLVTGAAAFYNVRESAERAQGVDESYEVRLQLLLLLSAHQDMETSHRGYAITGDGTFLEPYEQGFELADRAIGQVTAMVRDNPVQAVRLRELETLHRQRIEQSQRIVAVRQQRGAEAARRLIESGEGKRVMDGLRAIIGRMDDEESRLLAGRKVEERAGMARLNWTLLASMVFALLVVAVGGRVIQSDFRRRREAERTIREQNAFLEQRVHDRTAQLQQSEARIRSEADALRAANEELSAFNRIMVDRELRMIELKEEVNLLCGQLGRPPRYDLDFDVVKP